MILDESFFNKISDEKKDCIFVCSTLVSFPLNMLLHTYIVTSHSGEINRYEVFRKWGEQESQEGCVYKNLFPAWVGNRAFVGIMAKIFGTSRFSSTLIKAFDSDTHNIASLVLKINEIYLNYPGRYSYRYISPNSNTYTQWLLNEIGLNYQLLRMALGRKHRL